MLKRLLCLLLALAIALSLAGCVTDLLPNTSTPHGTASSFEVSRPESSTPSSNKPDKAEGSTQKPSQSGNTVSRDENIIDEIPAQTTSEDTAVISPSIKLPDIAKTPHTPLSKAEYYQYSTLNDNEKSAYRLICDAIENTQNSVNLKSKNLSFNDVWVIFQKVIADNPQYFWVSKFISYTEISENGKAVLINLYIQYTDGEITDTFDKTASKLIATADRVKIEAQISDFYAKSEALLCEIPPSLPDIEKEKLIHDGILKGVSYDYENMNNEATRENYLRIWDAYGALINGKAVCEGYSRLFQHLCYQVGINANYVVGNTQGQPHAWNVIKLNDGWYHIDVTWDDGSTDGLMIYSYFNLTANEILKDHTIDNTVYATPPAASVENAFYNTLGINIKDVTAPPENYEYAIDCALKLGDGYLLLREDCVAFENNDLFDYVNKYFNHPSSDIQKYLKSKGESKVFAPSNKIGSYIYLKII